MDTITRIDIGILGGVSVGKSALIHALFARNFSGELTRETMIPQIYIINQQYQQSEDAIEEMQKICTLNKNVNQKVSELINTGDFVANEYPFPYHYISSDIIQNVVNKDTYLFIYDLPGLDDDKGKKYYFDWAKNNLSELDIIIFVTDIHHGFVDLDEIKILELIFDVMKHHKNIHLICLLNKCDNLIYDENDDELCFLDKESSQFYIDINKFLLESAKKYNIPKDNFNFFLSISLEKAYVLRALYHYPQIELDKNYQKKWFDTYDNQELIKQIKEEYHQRIIHTGFCIFEDILKNTIIRQKMKIIINNLYDELNHYSLVDIQSIDSYRTIYLPYIMNLENHIPEESINKIYQTFWNNVKKCLEKCAHTMMATNVNIVGAWKSLMDYYQFENLHFKISNKCLELVKLINELKSIKFYPDDAFQELNKNMQKKLFSIYDDQFTLVPFRENIEHLTFPRIKNYLEIINQLDSSKLNKYITFFFNKHLNSKNMLFLKKDYTNEILNVLKYLINIKADKNIIFNVILNVLINKIYVTCHNSREKVFNYLIAMHVLLHLHLNKNPLNLLFIDFFYRIESIIIKLNPITVTSFFPLMDVNINKLVKTCKKEDSDISLDFEEELIMMITNM
jgi:hypothetical protein